MRAAALLTEVETVKTAYHEAGHAVIAAVLDLHVNGVTIIRREGSLGCTTSPNPIYGYEGSGKRDRQGRARDSIVTLYAGLAAESLFVGTPFSFEEDAEHGAWNDHEVAWELLREVHVRGSSFVGDDSYCRALERLQRKAKALVKQHRDAIQRVASALIERRTLKHEELLKEVEL